MKRLKDNDTKLSHIIVYKNDGSNMFQIYFDMIWLKKNHLFLYMSLIPEIKPYNHDKYKSKQSKYQMVSQPPGIRGLILAPSNSGKSIFYYKTSY